MQKIIREIVKTGKVYVWSRILQEWLLILLVVLLLLLGWNVVSEAAHVFKLLP